MGELWDIYDKNKKKTGRTAERGVDQLKEGEYHIVVTGMWECNGGSILKGETSLEGILRELKEEIGIQFTEKEAIYLKGIRRDKTPPDFKDIWLFKKDIEETEITFPDGESTECKWVSIEQFIDMFNRKEIVPTIDIEETDLREAAKR